MVGGVLPGPRSSQILRNTTSEFFHSTKQLGRQLGSAQSLGWLAALTILVALQVPPGPETLHPTHSSGQGALFLSDFSDFKAYLASP